MRQFQFVKVSKNGRHQRVFHLSAQDLIILARSRQRKLPSHSYYSQCRVGVTNAIAILSGEGGVFEVKR